MAAVANGSPWTGGPERGFTRQSPDFPEDWRDTASVPRKALTWKYAQLPPTGLVEGPL